jgi:hypothetical protein
MIVFQDIIKHIGYKQKTLLQATRERELGQLLRDGYLKPLVEYLKTDEKTQRDIRSQTGSKAQRENAAILDLKIHDFVPDFCPARIDEPPAIPSTSEPPAIPSIKEKANRTEAYLRSFILERLKRNYGSDRWWKQGLPGGLKKGADRDWIDLVRRKPYLRYEKDQNELKFELLGLGDMIHIVCYGGNWEQIFEEVFVDRANFERRIKDIAALRNPSSHVRRIDDQDMADGISGLLWLSRCISEPELNPYA